jgi:cell division protein FtsI/penicillin-binding protein 2
VNRFRARLLFFTVLFSGAAAAVTARLFTVQVLQGQAFAARSRSQSQERCLLPAARGTIYDRNGKVLAAGTQSGLSLSADLFGAAGGTGRNGGRRFRRVYPLQEAAGPLIGYIGKDGYGLGGAEFSFDQYLRGEDGWTMVQKDGRNRRYRKIGMPYKNPRAGSSVYLTIDAEIQKIVYGVLKQTIGALKARGGSCMVMDPVTGKVLAMVNEPSFDPNFSSRYALDQRKNVCISSIYEPGSTFKLVNAAAALRDNIKNERDVINGDHGVYKIYKETIRDHEPFGRLTFAQAMAFSSNVCFAKIAKEVGAKRLFRCMRDFGFGERCGIALPGEERGILHPVRNWSGRTLVTIGIGQELSVTLIQMMAAYAAVANNGIMVSPLICEKIVREGKKVVEQPAVKPVRRVLPERTARRLCSMLRMVVDSGTGRNAAVPDVAVAGKTGTAQKYEDGSYSRTKSWASFFGFLPVDRPVLLCGVVIDEPADNLMGGTAAAPVFRKIMTQIISHPGLEFAEEILNSRSVTAGTAAVGEVFTDASADQAPAEIEPAALSCSGSLQTVPDCRGRDARDAVGLMSIHGLVPFVIGAGVVQQQSPPAGSLRTAAHACTLICSFGG